MDIRDHRLRAEGIRHEDSPNRGGPFAAGRADTIVIHYTAGENAESAIRTLTDPERRVSAHLVVGKGGSITQLLPFDTVGWHAGASQWQGRTSLNQYSIGIEIDNAGQLEERDGRCVSWFGKAYPESEVVRGVHRNQEALTPWHRFPYEQIRLVEELCALLMAEYGIEEIVGHEEIAPGRKIDPGPAFPLDEMRQRLSRPIPPVVGAGEEGEAEEGEVRARRLNIRTAPDRGSEQVAGHLKEGTRVRILERQRGWHRVAVELEGWVSSRYIRPLDESERES
jgi:N-acetylmuramoyl-L-alanine amidase